MNNGNQNIVQMSLVAVCLLLGAVFCDASVYMETWTDNAAGWQIKNEDEDPAYAGTFGKFSGTYLSIGVSPASDSELDIIYADVNADGTLIEDHTAADLSIQFDFYAKDQAPHKLYAYLRGTNDSDEVILWKNEITSVTVDAWTGYAVGLGYTSGGGWIRWDDTPLESDWNQVLANVDEVGILIWYEDQNYADQEYYLDNYTIDAVVVIPEPETWLMLGFALLSIAITFRRQIDEAVSKVRLNT